MIGGSHTNRQELIAFIGENPFNTFDREALELAISARFLSREQSKSIFRRDDLCIRSFRFWGFMAIESVHPDGFILRKELSLQKDSEVGQSGSPPGS